MRYNRTQIYSITPTLQIAGAYSANDVVGGLLEIETGTGKSEGGVIRRLLLVDDDNEKAALTLYLFHEKPSTIADDAAFAPSVADLKKLAGVITIAATDYVTVNGNAYALMKDLSVEYRTDRLGKLYGYLVCTATPTYTATDNLYLKLVDWSD